MIIFFLRIIWYSTQNTHSHKVAIDYNNIQKFRDFLDGTVWQRFTWLKLSWNSKYCSLPYDTSTNRKNFGYDNSTLPPTPCHENQTKNIKCKYIVEHIVEINIWSREISLGRVENAGQWGGLRCHQYDSLCTVYFVNGQCCTRVLREKAKITSKRVCLYGIAWHHNWPASFTHPLPVVGKMRSELPILYVKFSASPFHLVTPRGTEFVVHSCGGWLCLCILYVNLDGADLFYHQVHTT